MAIDWLPPDDSEAFARKAKDMTINDIERVDSGGGSVSIGSDGLMARQVEVRWLVQGIDGYEAAEEKGRELAPIFYDGHRRGDLSCRPVANGWYEISAQYGNAGVDSFEGRGIKTDDDVTMIPVSISVDTTGSTDHITEAYPHPTDGPIYRGYAASDETAPESYGAINVSGGRVNGVDVTVPTFSWSETWLVPTWYLLSGKKPTDEERKSDVGTDPKPEEPYVITLHDMTGSVNEDSFRGFDPGEVLYLGARFEAGTSATMTAVTYSFQAKPNEKNIKIKDVTVEEKKGWEYLWIDYGDEVSEGVPVKFPRYVYVDQIYKEKKLEELRIGKFWPRFYLTGGDVFTHSLDTEKRETALDPEKNDLA
jgi:hypothetical protein